MDVVDEDEVVLECALDGIAVSLDCGDRLNEQTTAVTTMTAQDVESQRKSSHCTGSGHGIGHQGTHVWEAVAANHEVEVEHGV